MIIMFGKYGQFAFLKILQFGSIGFSELETAAQVQDDQEQQGNQGDDINCFEDVFGDFQSGTFQSRNLIQIHRVR